jgi:methionyl-tRNA formyltransferase
LRVAFAGTPEFALPALAALRSQYELVGVLTQPDRPSGRGRKLSASAVKTAALAYELPLAQPETLRSEAARTELAAWHPDVLVVVAYGLILPREVLALPRFGCVNIHASLLPRWRGAAPIERALLAGDAETGVSIMQMDAGLDTGPVLLQRRLGISSDHTTGTLREALAALGAAALLEALEGLSRGTLQPHVQPGEGATYAPKIAKAEAHIDWTRDALQIERQVRAFNPWPIAETRFEGEQLRIFAARAIGSAAAHPASASGGSDANEQSKGLKSADPGSIVAVHDGAMFVQCGRGCLAVTQVQRPGRRTVSARDFAHGLSLVGRKLG